MTAKKKSKRQTKKAPASKVARKTRPTVEEMSLESFQLRIMKIARGLIERFETQLSDPDFVVKPSDIAQAMKLAQDMENFESRFESIQKTLLSVKGELKALEDRLIGLIEK